MLDSAEFQQFSAEVAKRVDNWFASNRKTLASIGKNTKPNHLIDTLGDGLLERFRDTPLLDEYDVYEQLLSYWHETMHDDVFLIMHEGWVGAARPRPAIEDKDRKLSETPDIVIGSGKKATKVKTDLIPPALIVARWLADDHSKLEKLNAQAQEAARAVEEYIEEHAIENGQLSTAIEDGKITKALASARLGEAKCEDSDAEEIAALEHAVALFDTESAAHKAAKKAKAALDLATLKKYGDLTESDVKELVLDDKWEATVSHRVGGVLTSLVLNLLARLQILGERYGDTLAYLEAELDDLNTRVREHLAEMGVR